jgi:hypothetical protein
MAPRLKQFCAYAIPTSGTVRKADPSTIHNFNHAVHCVFLLAATFEEMGDSLLDISPETTIPISVDAA